MLQSVAMVLAEGLVIREHNRKDIETKDAEYFLLRPFCI